MGESRPHGFCQMLAFGVFILVIEKNIGLVSLVPAVHMYEDSSFVGVFILLEQGVYLVTSLFQAANLVEGIGLPMQVSRLLFFRYLSSRIPSLASWMIMWTLAPFIMRLRASRSTMS